MKKLIGTTICTFLIILILSCEKDDFCILTPVTPNLVIRFHDVDDEDETKEVDSLYVWAEGMDSIYNYTTSSVGIDSIALPLNTLSENTVYHLAQGTSLLDTFTISYTTEEEYVSRSCGFRVIFNNIELDNNTEGNEDSWISSFTPNTLTTINEQESAHVKIYH